jgi:RNA polymerase sigma-70 factor (ECF subfamily)
MRAHEPSATFVPRAGTETGESFEEVVLPHLKSAYRLARWLLRSEEDAEDVVQEASLRALRYFRTFTGGNGRAWFLRVVRNTCYRWRSRNDHGPTDPFDEERHGADLQALDPEALVRQIDDVTLIEGALRNVPERFRELLVLREVDGLSYRELADVLDVPIGTVMSSLSRARHAFRGALNAQLEESGMPARGRHRNRDTGPVLV